MCGIVGYIGDKEVIQILMDGLSRLEYRGYDSAGAAVISDGKVSIRKEVGKLKVLKESLPKGRSFITENTEDIPKILKNILSSSIQFSKL